MGKKSLRYIPKHGTKKAAVPIYDNKPPKIGVFDQVFLIKARSTIERLIKEERFVYTGNDSLEYTDRLGNKKPMTFFEFGMVLAEQAAGMTDPLKMELAVKQVYKKHNGGK